MKNNSIVILFMVFQLAAFSQPSKGIIEYTGAIDSVFVNKFIKDLEQKKELPNHIKKEVIDLYRNAQPEQFKLQFKDDESFFTNEGILSVDSGYRIGSNAGPSSYYSNKNIIIQYSVLGYIKKVPLEWNMTSERKKIGDFNCLKATATEELYDRRGYTYDRSVIAWFTTDIPISFGPQNYSGLPGLVIEVITDVFTLRATKVDLNPTEDVKIKPPKESKIITQAQANSFIKQESEDN